MTANAPTGAAGDPRPNLRRRIAGWWTDRALRTKALAALGIPVTSLLVAALAFSIVEADARAARASVDRAFEVAALIDHSRALLLESETGARGYVLTGDRASLEPYGRAVEQLPNALARLGELMTDEPQQARLSELRALIARRLDVLSRLIAVGPVDSTGLSPGQRGLLDEGRAVMDDIRTAIDAMDAADQRLLNERQARAESAAAIGELLVGGLLLVGLAGSLLAAFLLTAGVVRRVRQLEVNAGLLADGRELQPLPQANDEVGRLATNLERASGLLRERERALREAVDELNDLYDNAPAGYYSRDADGVVTRMNATALRWLGYEREEVVGRLRSSDLYAPDSLGRFEELAETIRQQGVLTDVELDMRRRDGTSFPVRGSISAVRDEDGRIVGARVSVIDISARRAAEREAQRSRAELNQFFALSADMFAVFNADGTFQAVNPAWKKSLGYEPGDLVGRPFLDLVHPDDRDRTIAVFQQASASTGTVSAFENRYRHRDGSYRWLDWVGGAVPGEDVHFSTARDITDRRRAANVFRQTVEAAPTAIVVVNREGTITLVNDQTERLFGYPRSELVGRPVEVLVPDHLRANHPAQRDGYFAEPAARAMGTGDELWGRHRDGRAIAIEVALSPVESDEGLTVLATVVDVTQRRAYEAAIQSARREAESANRAKSEFLSRMSHELRTPLNAILGFAQLLGMDHLDVDQRESVDHIHRAGRHLLDLINEVLDISRIETGELSISPEPVGVHEAVADAIALISPLAAPLDVTVRAEEIARDRHVLADRQRLKQVLLNLLSNAVKYNRPGGLVTVACTPAGPAAMRLTVTDEGPGITPALQARLFRPFERLGAEGSLVEGTGLGLALTKALVEHMDGRIGVDSTPGEGSSFWVELPLASAAPTTIDIAPEPEPALIAARTAGSVLYIEDNVSNFRLIERVLAGRGNIRLLSAMLGRLGLDLARQHRPDIILLDLHLPDIPGDELLGRLRADPTTRHIPVIVLSADATPGQIERLLAQGARAYLSKPLDLPQFVALIDELLRADRLASGTQP